MSVYSTQWYLAACQRGGQKPDNIHIDKMQSHNLNFLFLKISHLLKKLLINSIINNWIWVFNWKSKIAAGVFGTVLWHHVGLMWAIEHQVFPCRHFWNKPKPSSVRIIREWVCPRSQPQSVWTVSPCYSCFTFRLFHIRLPSLTFTVGFTVGTIDVGKARLMFWDLGGQEELQSLWDKVSWWLVTHRTVQVALTSWRLCSPPAVLCWVPRSHLRDRLYWWRASVRVKGGLWCVTRAVFSDVLMFLPWKKRCSCDLDVFTVVSCR